MLNSLKNHARYALEIGLAFMPWLASMYILYWLEHGEVWTTETAHRGKISVTILAVGMGLSFLIQSRLSARRKSK